MNERSYEGSISLNFWRSGHYKSFKVIYLKFLYNILI